METLSFRRARAGFDRLLRRVVRTRKPVAIEGAAGAVVLLPLRDWTARVETLHLLSTVTNAKRLRAAIDELDAPD